MRGTDKCCWIGDAFASLLGKLEFVIEIWRWNIGCSLLFWFVIAFVEKLRKKYHEMTKNSNISCQNLLDKLNQKFYDLYIQSNDKERYDKIREAEKIKIEIYSKADLCSFQQCSRRNSYDTKFSLHCLQKYFPSSTSIFFVEERIAAKVSKFFQNRLSISVCFFL